MKDFFKSIWFWLVIAAGVLFLTRKYWLPNYHEIKISDVDWDKKSARVYTKSGDVSGGRVGDVFGEVHSLNETSDQTPTTNGFIFTRDIDKQNSTMTIGIYKLEKSEDGEIVRGRKIREVVIDFKNKEIRKVK